MNLFTNKEYSMTAKSINQLRSKNNLNFFSVLWLLVILLWIFPSQLIGQDTTKVIPDGTQGETMKVGRKDTVLTIGNWNEFDGPLTTLKLGGGFLYEFAGYSQDVVGKQQMDSANVVLKSAFKVRDFRLIASGKVKSKRFFTWKAGIMFDASVNSWYVRETGLMIGAPELSGYFFVGRTKEGFSLNKVMNGYAGWTMERQIAIDVIPILADGIKLMSYLPKQKLFWNIGVYTDWLSEGQSFSTYRWQFDIRFGWLPIYSEADKTLLHLGINYRYGKPVDEAIRLRSRPEANPAPYFIDTEEFPAEHSNHYGWEVYFTSGPLMLGSEYYFHQFSSAETENPLFQGGEVVASYLITGESRPYSTVSGIYGFVPVANSVFDGGAGTWEVILRFSTLNLTSGTISGGKFWRITPMINWYLSANVRLEIAYGYGVLNRFNLEGVTQFFQSRIQLML
ncbi:MAG: OprO/OprP family phosphate-selective porin [Ignavibacteriales bacterium]